MNRGVTAEECAQANVMGMISGNQCILSHLKASEPFMAFLSHEVPLFGERITLNRQVGHEHTQACTHTHKRAHTCTCISPECREDDPAVSWSGAVHTNTHVHSGKSILDDLIAV